MKKLIFLITFLIFCLSFQTVNAGRYDDGQSSYVEGKNGTNCGSVYCTNLPNITIIAPGDNEYDDGTSGENKGRVISNSNASRSGNITIYSWDSQVPVANDVNSLTDIMDYYLANDLRNIQISVNQVGGAPITYIEGVMENNNNSSNWNIKKTSNSSLLNTTENLSNTNINLENNNYRDFTYRITKVCDKANNCTNNIKNFIYHVYANNVDSNNSSIVLNDIFDDEIADGIEKKLTVQLKDKYNNIIIPVKNIDGIQERIVILSGLFTNTSYKNQFLLNGESGIKVSDFEGSLFNYAGNNISTIINDVENSDGEYELKFKVYSPTYLEGANDGRQYAKGNFIINQILVDVSDIAGYINVEDTDIPINFQFKPLYYTKIVGDINDNGFNEGSFQTGSLDISFATGTTIPGTLENKLHYIKVGTSSGSFTASGMLDPGLSGKIYNTGLGDNFINNTFDTINNYILSLLFILDDINKFRNDIKDLRLEEYIRYTLDGEEITYLSNILNQSNSQSFETLKILGITNIDSDKQKDLVQDQDIDDIQNLNGEITKSSLKRDIRKNAINTVKFVSTDNGINKQILDLSGNNWNNGDGKELGNILYFGDLSGNNVELGDGSELIITGRKTIVVRGGNLYIKSNIINNGSDDILGIIVLEDEFGNGGQLYIDNTVQEIDAIIYSDKSIIGYNNLYGEIDGNINTNVISDQLYIYGTIFSENTIGGSRIDPPVCPFYTESIVGFTCDITEAQKYDLNYLRVGVGSSPRYIPSSGNNYPIVIKYNSVVQISPPPLFTK